MGYHWIIHFEINHPSVRNPMTMDYGNQPHFSGQIHSWSKLLFSADRPGKWSEVDLRTCESHVEQIYVMHTLGHTFSKGLVHVSSTSTLCFSNISPFLNMSSTISSCFFGGFLPWASPLFGPFTRPATWKPPRPAWTPGVSIGRGAAGQIHRGWPGGWLRAGFRPWPKGNRRGTEGELKGNRKGNRGPAWSSGLNGECW